MAVVKCAWCAERGDKVLFTQGKNKKYYHTDKCFPAHLQDCEFKKQEAQELDDLVHTIVEIHKIETGIRGIPSSFYPLIQELRNDSILFGKVKKSYKKGLTYPVIRYTYRFCARDIEWARNNKQFKNFMSELKYCLAIVRNNIENAVRDRMKKQKQKQETEKLVNNIESMQAVNVKIKNVQQATKQVTQEEDTVDLTTLFE